MNTPGPRDDAVALVRWQPEDAPFYVDSVQDELVQHFTTDPAELTVGDVVRAIRASAEDLRHEAFLVVDAQSGERLGNIAVQLDGSVGDVSYWVCAAARGRGIGARSLALVSAWALTELHVDELRLWTHVDNAASRSVAERAGYRRDLDRDGDRRVRDAVWPTVAYRLRGSASCD